MRALWALDGDAGRRAHGDGFTSIDELDEIHRQNAAQRDADHFHEGFGFLAQHAKLSWRFERALQSVDAAVALPYWDSTVEMAAAERAMIAAGGERTRGAWG